MGFAVACGGGGEELPVPTSPDAGPVDRGPAMVCGSGSDGDACDDGDPCTTDDVCAAGVCEGAPKTCATDLACHTAACNPSTGACEETPVDDGAACDDGDLCTTDDTCVAGVCTAGDPVTCDGSTTCVVGVCNPDTGECEGEPAANGTSCENECVFNGRCSDGECRGSTRLCPSPGDCRIRLGCDPLQGCQYEHLEDGLDCSDDDVCTLGDQCEDGVCVGQPLVCPEPPACKASICDPEVGCALVDLPDETACDDGNECSFESVCRAGECVATQSVECRVRACMSTNTCNPDTGRCEPTYVSEGAACNDLNACTEGEFCNCVEANNCATLFCGGGTEIPWTGTLCSDDICFTDVTTQAGITWSAPSGAPHEHAAGAVMADLDGDGWQDIAIVGETQDLTLYLNDQAGGFTDETASSGFSVVNTATTTWQGISAGDYDDDGDLDLYVSFNGPNFLLENDGSAHFTDVTAASGTQDTRWSTGSVFGDMDEDGDLDLIVGNYVAKTGSFFPNHIAIDNSVFRNNGNGTFTDVAGTLNVGGAGTGSPGATLIVAFTDYDQDGDADIMECNDFGQTVTPNRLYENDGSGRFTEVSASEGADVELFCMGIAQGDYDRDLDFDYYHTSIGHHALLSQGRTGFTERAAQMGARLENDDCFQHEKQAGWGAIMEDFDNDGWQDIFVVNGYITADSSIKNPEEQENKLLKNPGFGRPFDDISKSAGVASTGEGRGLAAGDYDQDGDIDMLVINNIGPPELYRNDSRNQGRHLVVELEGQISNRFAPNAIIEAEFESFTLLREYGIRPGYASSSPTEVYLGADSELVAEQIEVLWPSGIVSRHLEVPTNARVNIVEPTATIDALEVPGAVSPNVQLTATATLTNHSATSQTVDLDLELWDADANVYLTERRSYDLSGLSTRRVHFDFRTPTTLPAGALRWVGSVSDSASAVDQREDRP
jgi:hypothetical protein